MASYSPAELLVALGQARVEAQRLGVTVHVVEKSGWRSLLTKGPFKIVTDLGNNVCVIRDVHPLRWSDEMIRASTAALGYDADKERVVLDMLRAITHKPDHEAFDTEQIAVLVWKLAEELAERDFQEGRLGGRPQRVA